MTLKIRNTLLNLFTILSVICVLASAAALALSLHGGKTTSLAENYRILRVAPFSMAAAISSILILVVFVPLATFSITHFFGKTKSAELVFFVAFLIGLLVESLRLVMISVGLWQTFSDILLIFGRIILFGRVLAILSFFFASLSSANSQQDSFERDFMILATFSAIFAILTPLNTYRITTTGMVTVGFPTLYNAIKATIIALTAALFLRSASTRDEKNFLPLAASFLVLILGYQLLLDSDSFPALALGAAMLFFGSHRYLLAIHRIYIWQ